ncbi:MAG: patatin-like phospholipase family protein, partial [Bacteroidota bacterium]
MSESKKVFHLGIAMAGAVSAGAYTAGVMDYLLETLQRWQEAKDKNRELGPDHPEYDPSIPMHDVVIEAMGGSSAGGMTAAISALSLFEGVDLKEWDPNKKKLYDAWVNLNDNNQDKLTLEQLLETDDIENAEELPSVLNSTPIDQIADRARHISRTDGLPAYISKSLEIILTITSLRGIPIAVNFFDAVKKQDKYQPNETEQVVEKSNEPLPAHKMYLHKGVAHFQFDLEGKGTPPYTVPFHPEQEWAKDLLLDCAKATGAFPIGLKARKLKGINLGYVKAMAYRMFGLEMPDSEMNASGIDIQSKSDPFDLVAVDGGTVNNEPFGEIIRALEEKYGEEGNNHAVIMIDPFPNFETVEQEDANIQHPSNVIEVIPNLLGAIRAQAMVKEKEIVRGLSSDYTRKMIFPKKKDDPFPIACGSLDGFGGFFSREFREHDYRLGRRNCQRFLRKHLSIHLNNAKDHELFKDWKQDGSDARHSRFYVKFSDKENDGAYPIIPDLGIEKMSRDLFYDEYEKEPVKAQVSAQDIIDLDKKFQKRFSKVLFYFFKTDRKTMDTYSPDTRSEVNQIMEAHFKKPGLFSKIFNRIATWYWKNYGTKKVAKILSEKVIGEILLDF